MYATGTSRIGFPEQYAARYTINHEGWNSTKEYSSSKSNKRRIAVIGDSFVDALQVNVDRCFAELLENDLNHNSAAQVEVYRFGFGGASLSQYLNVLRYVKKKYDPDVIVVSIQANDFLTSILPSANEDGDFLQFVRKGKAWIEVPPVPYKPSKLRLGLKHSALFRYIYGNLEFRYRMFALDSLFKKQNRERKYQMNVDIETDLYQIDLFRDLSLHILREMKKELGPQTKLVLFMDADRDALYHGYDLKREKSYELTKMLRSASEELAVSFLDLSGPFEEDYKQFHQRFDFDTDRHWNERGHRIVAQTLSAHLRQNGW